MAIATEPERAAAGRDNCAALTRAWARDARGTDSVSACAEEIPAVWRENQLINGTRPTMENDWLGYNAVGISGKDSYLTLRRASDYPSPVRANGERQNASIVCPQP